MLEKVLLNLLSNAYKFTFDGHIELRVRVAETAVIEVADSGVGIPEEELPRLFERFHRVSGAEGRSHEGSGIGLALVHELVRLHGGEVSVASRIGEGSRFRIELPLRRPATQAPAAASSRGASVQRDGLRRRRSARWGVDERTIELPAADDERPEVLVVDDNADLRTYLTRLLESDYVVRTAVDGADALATISERPPDLVLTDVMMPRIDGFELLAALRADPRTRRLPVIVLSARAGEEAMVEGLDAGADDYLVKPFSGPSCSRACTPTSRSRVCATRSRRASASGRARWRTSRWRCSAACCRARCPTCSARSCAGATCRRASRWRSAATSTTRRRSATGGS